MTSKEPTTDFRAHSISCDLGVAACVVIDDKILLVKEAVGKHAGRWGAPKGYANSDEHPMQSALRELKEECGIDGAIKGIIAVRETIRSDIPALFIGQLPERCPLVHSVPVERAIGGGGADSRGHVCCADAWCTHGS